MDLYEILVPTERADGRFYSTRYHRVFDQKVRDITGGLTVLKPCVGQWLSPTENNKLYKERMIPVRIACTREQIEQICDIVGSYYSQLAVFAYKVSDEVIIKNYTLPKSKSK